MDRYQQRFEELKKNGEGAFIPFVVLGDPDPETSLNVIKQLINSGADMLELGIPFSDPIADGPSIQKADQRALKAGMNSQIAFEMIREIRTNARDIPIGLLVYANLIFGAGVGQFCEASEKSGVDSILAADVPIEESHLWVEEALDHNIQPVHLISLNTPHERIGKILKNPTAFHYLVAQVGVTGTRTDLQSSILAKISELSPMANSPICVGFGISLPEHIQPLLSAGASGVICGSAVVELIEANLHDRSRMIERISQFTQCMKEQTKKGIMKG